MNIKRIIFWTSFAVVLGLIIWGLIVAMHKSPGTGGVASGTPMPLTADDHVRGPENAPVTIIEYADYQCPACASYHPVIEKLLVEASTTVRFVARHFPLPGHRNAVAASKAAEAAGKQGKYWDMAALLFDNQKSWETLTGTQAKDVFKGYAERLNINIALYEKDFDSTQTKNKIDGDVADGNKIGVKGTPTFFINGKSITNPAGYEAFKTLVDAASTTSSN